MSPAKTRRRKEFMHKSCPDLAPSRLGEMTLRVRDREIDMENHQELFTTKVTKITKEREVRKFSRKGAKAQSLRKFISFRPWRLCDPSTLLRACLAR
jgi:hypothetical protein